MQCVLVATPVSMVGGVINKLARTQIQSQDKPFFFFLLFCFHGGGGVMRSEKSSSCGLVTMVKLLLSERSADSRGVGF